MGKSTAGLGRELGLNSQETNILLRDEGYLEGEPGDWRLTDKGREHAEQQHWDVPSSMHAGYLTTRWGDEVLEDIGTVSPERKRQIDDEISARRAEQRRQREERQAELEDRGNDNVDDDYSYRQSSEEDPIEGKTAGAIVAVIAGGILLAKGVKWAKPRVEKWWKEAARPKLIATKEKAVAKFKKNTGERQSEEGPAPASETLEESKDVGEKNADKD
jgi:hypothetical protein